MAPGLNLIMDSPIWGHGPRYFSSIGQESLLSWYLMLIVESGIITFSIIYLHISYYV